VAWYFDTSALVKLVVVEAETPALMDWLRSKDRRAVGSDIARVELIRAVRRVPGGNVVRARAVLASLELLTISADLLDRAALIEPASLRALDAIHLASALAIGDALEGVVAYDARLLDAARNLGLETVSPA
jgi:predicted nucleic acid-binding protein